MSDLSKEFDGRVALVTGGASGIGLELCHRLGTMGAKVVIGDRDFTVAQALEAELTAKGIEALAVMLDVSDPVSVVECVKAAQARFGSISLCANNAGITTPRLPLADIPTEDWMRQLAVNLTGVFNCLQAVLPALVAAGGGAIVNTSSICGLIGVAGTAAYTAAKHGVVGLTKVAALDYADKGVRVNAVAPGYVDTPLLSDRSESERQLIAERHPLNRMATPGEIADAMCYLLSDRSSFVTGTVIAADGGYTAR